MSPTDSATLAHVAAQAGPALHGARVVGELIQARSRVVRAREEERKRLRRDLHDELAPTFAGLGLSAAAVETFTRVGDARASDAAAQLVAGLQAASRQLRDVAYDLRPPVLDEEGLVAALRERILTPGSSPEITMDAPRDRLELPAAVESAAYRIAQEAVMNVRRHAAASHCHVTISLDAGALRLEVEDDGIGVRPGRPGVGLRSMRERAVELGGSLDLTRPEGGGTAVIALLPLGSDPPITTPAPADAAGVG
jgi:signal transduction histidine kinase